MFLLRNPPPREHVYDPSCFLIVVRTVYMCVCVCVVLYLYVFDTRVSFYTTPIRRDARTEMAKYCFGGESDTAGVHSVLKFNFRPVSSPTQHRLVFRDSFCLRAAAVSRAIYHLDVYTHANNIRTCDLSRYLLLLLLSLSSRYIVIVVDLQPLLQSHLPDVISRRIIDGHA